MEHGVLREEDGAELLRVITEKKASEAVDGIGRHLMEERLRGEQRNGNMNKERWKDFGFWRENQACSHQLMLESGSGQLNLWQAWVAMGRVCYGQYLSSHAKSTRLLIGLLLLTVILIQ